MSTLSFNSWTNLDGSENYKCRAWVDFNGIGTVTIRGSGNVTSITDNGVGDYTVNFAVAMPSVNYASVTSIQTEVSGVAGLSRFTSQTVSAYRFLVADASPTAIDVARIKVSVFV